MFFGLRLLLTHDDFPGQWATAFLAFEIEGVFAAHGRALLTSRPPRAQTEVGTYPMNLERDPRRYFGLIPPRLHPMI
jgi:hypothetical protein